MQLTEQEKQEWGSRVESHLLDGVDIFEVANGWVWGYIDNFFAHETHPVPNNTVYSSHEKCVNAVAHLMRNSSKLDYAKGMATEGMNYTRAKNA